MSQDTPEDKFAPALIEVIARQEALVDALCRAGIVTADQLSKDMRYHQLRLRDLAAKLDGATEDCAQQIVHATETAVAERRRPR